MEREFVESFDELLQSSRASCDFQFVVRGKLVLLCLIFNNTVSVSENFPVAQ